MNYRLIGKEKTNQKFWPKLFSFLTAKHHFLISHTDRLWWHQGSAHTTHSTKKNLDRKMNKYKLYKTIEIHFVLIVQTKSHYSSHK